MKVYRLALYESTSDRESPVCPHCGNSDGTWLYSDPWSGPEVVCECLFGQLPGLPLEGDDDDDDHRAA